MKLTETLQNVLASVKAPTPTKLLNDYMDEMYARFVERRDKHQPQPPNTGTRECAAIILGDFKRPELSREYMMRFLRLPRYSGWPPWVRLMNIHSSLGQVAYVNDGWESFQFVTQVFHSLDFSRIDASGKFYYLEALRDDISGHVHPSMHLEFVIETARVTEIIAICLAFAKEFCGPDSSNDLGFAFRWLGLRGRQLSTWANPNKNFYSRELADQDEIVTYVTMPVQIVPDAIGLHVESVVKPVFRLFGGVEFEGSVMQDIISGRLNNRL